jgi:hypothetical protein
MTYLIIFRGDDTDFEGNQNIDITLSSEIDLSDKKAHFKFLDFIQDWDTIPDDKVLHLKIPNAQTSKFPVGAMDAKLWLEDSQGRVRMVDNRIHIVVTDRVDEAYDSKDPQAITVVISGGAVSWETITGKPDTFPSTWDNVSDKPETFQSAWDSVSGKPEKFDSSWDKVSDKPTTFPTKWSEVQDKPDAFASTWDSISGKPTTFPPSSHTHEIEQITDWSNPDWESDSTVSPAYIKNKPWTRGYYISGNNITLNANDVNPIIAGSRKFYCLANPGHSITMEIVGVRNVDFMWVDQYSGLLSSNKIGITFGDSEAFKTLKLSKITYGRGSGDNYIYVETVPHQSSIALQ